MNKFSILSVFLAAALAAACSTKDVQGVCQNDGDCPANFHCGADYQCLCDNDQACALGEFCSAAGHCQKIQGCRTDPDCGDPANFRCQILPGGAGQCLCKNDNACQTGEFCNLSGQCQKKAGCISDSDCGDPNLFRCFIDPVTKVGGCLCKADAACEQGQFCNPKGFCQPLATCQKNEDCPPGKTCKIETGECLCNHEDNTGCLSTEVCNASGYCQPRPGCFDNRDCADVPNTFCDTETKVCIPIGSCNSDRQCQIGQVCANHACVAGCRGNEDCPLDQRCVNAACVGGCQGDEFCDFAQFCVSGACQNAYTAQTPYCKPCVNTDLTMCGDRKNTCLIYQYTGDEFSTAGGNSCTRDSQCTSPMQCNCPKSAADPTVCQTGQTGVCGYTEYCAPDCSANQRCPNGFECNSIISVKSTDICPAHTCPQGLPCLMGESDTGYCPCHPTKNPCPANTCIADTCLGGVCYALSLNGIRLPCQTANDCKVCSVNLLSCATTTCPAIQCVTYDGVDYGGCVSAQSCGLMEGVHCPKP